MEVANVLSMICGITLLLFGMDTMGKGLEKLAGGGLKTVLKKLTSNAMSSFILGLAVTAVIQSSAATTVLVEGFINSGVMELTQATGVIIGANVGTTVTSWLLSLTGINGTTILTTIISPSFFGPVLGIIGIAMRMWCKAETKKYTGTILLGFAVLMTGMSTISSAVKPLAQEESFVNMLVMFSNPFMGVVVGTLVCCLLQSSSASIGVLQALAVTGVTNVAGAYPIVIGMNIGSSLMPIIASVGANKDAKKASILYLVFNMMGGIVTLVPYFIITRLILPGIASTPVNAVMVAVIHTSFKAFTALVALPLTRQMLKIVDLISARLEKKSKKREPEDRHILLLDERLFSTPSLAVAQSRNHVVAMANEAHQSLLSAISVTRNYDKSLVDIVEVQEDDVDKYEDTLSTYLVHLSAQNLTTADSSEVSGMLHIIGDLERLSDHAVNITEVATELHDKNITFSTQAWNELSVLSSAITEILNLTIISYSTRNMEMASMVEPLEQVIDNLTKTIRMNHIERLRAGDCTIELGFVLGDLLGNYERISDHCSNIAVAMIELAKNTFDTHEYLNSIKNTGEEHFQKLFNEYTKKYSFN